MNMADDDRTSSLGVTICGMSVRSSASGQDDLRAFQTSSQGHCRAQSKVAIGCLVVEPGGGWISMRSAISSPQ